MNEKTQHNEPKVKPAVAMSKNARIAALAAFTLVSIGAISLSVWTIVTSMDDSKPGQQYGVGADGFRAYIDNKVNLDVDKVVTKKQVESVLKNLAKSVDNGKIVAAFNLNGNLGQTVTFPFVRNDGIKSSLYIDKRVYKDQKALDNDHIYDLTMKSGTAKGYTIYFRAAQTISNDREYSLMVVNGTTAYRFVIAQPLDNISITEVTALVALKNLAQQSNL